MHIYSLRVWDWPRACNCQEGEIFLVLFSLRESRLVGRGQREEEEEERDQRTFKEIYDTYIAVFLVRIESTKE